MTVHRSSFRFVSIVIVALGTIAVQGDPQQPRRSAEDSVAVPDFRPALEQLNERFDDIDREIKRLKAAGKDNEAAQLEVHLINFKSWLKGPYRPPKGDEPEVHVVGIHVGQHPPGVRPMGDFNPPGKAEVKLTHNARPVILVICAYNPIQWTIQVDPRAEVERVIVGGYHAQGIIGLGDKIPVTRAVHDEGAEAYFHAYRKDAESYPRVAATVQRLANREIMTFQGMYEYKGQPVVVGLESEEWRTQHVLARTAEVHKRASQFERERVRAEMRKLQFQALHRVGDSKTSFGTFSPLGPVAASLVPLPKDTKHLAIDPNGPSYFGIGGHEVWALDLKARNAWTLPLDAGLPELSWPCGLAFDSKRNRVVLSSLGGVGFFYAYDPAAKKWSLISDLNNIDLWALTYAADDDSLYGVGMSSGAQRTPAIFQFNAKGALVRQVSLSPPPSTHEGRPDRMTQLAYVGKKLVLLLQPMRSREPGELDFTTAHVVDPQSGKIVFSTRHALQDAAKP